MEKRVVIQVLAVGQPVILVVEDVSYYVGCEGDTANKETVGTLSLCNCVSDERRLCDEIERTVVLNAIVCRDNNRAGSLPTFRHERAAGETWWQMIVNSMPAT